MRTPSTDVVGQTVAEFQFKQDEEIMFRALIGGMLAGLEKSESHDLIKATEEKISQRILDAALQRLDELNKKIVIQGG